MKFMKGQVDGTIVAEYRKGKFTLTFKVSNGFYCVTFHNGRQTAVTRYSKNKDEMNAYITDQIKKGYRKITV